MLHSTEGALEATLSWFTNPVSEASAHYVIARDGRIFQMVAALDCAYHSRGTPSMYPAWLSALPSPGLMSKANGYTIGVELVQEKGVQDFTEAQYQAAKWLLVDRAAAHSITFDRQHVLAHSEIQDDRTDPRGFLWERIYATADGVNSLLLSSRSFLKR